MSIPRFTFTDRAAPFIQLGLGDTRTDLGLGRWDVAHWDDADDATWSGAEPTWLDETCRGYSIELTNGRQRNTDVFAPATATITLDNSDGWVDDTLVMLRPGRSLRVGINHATLGAVVLFRGIIDAVTEVYTPDAGDSVELSAVCALGEVGRVRLAKLDEPVGVGESFHVRVARILDAAKFPASKRSLEPTGVSCLATELGQQVADMFNIVAESTGGAVWGDVNGNVVFRRGDWQFYETALPVDGTIGNVASADVCPSEWDLAHRRDDLVTQCILGRAGVDKVPAVYNDTPGQEMYGVETFQATDLVCENGTQLTAIAVRQFRVRGGNNSKERVERVLLDAATAADVVDLATVANPFTPTRLRCRLTLPRGVVFDAQLFVTGVRHSMTPDQWTCDLDLDTTRPFAVAGDARWDSNTGFDNARWAGPTLMEVA